MERSNGVPTLLQQTARKFDRPSGLTLEPASSSLSGFSRAQALEPAESRLKACRACGDIQSLPTPRAGYDRKCRRCGETMGSGLVNLYLALPVLVAALIAFIVLLSL